MKDTARLTLTLAAMLPVLTACARTGPALGRNRKIIKTGQDMPNARYCREHVREMEKLPFDGVTIGLDAAVGDTRERLAFRWWAPERITPEQVRDSVEDLKATRFRRFTDNFLWISTQSQPLPAPSWLDDEAFAAIRANMVLAARVARECGLKGVFLDVEQYGGMKWSRWMMRFNYPYAHANEKGMIGRGLVDRIVPHDEYDAAARRRGREIMSAMCAVFPDITVLVLPGIHQVAKERIGAGAHYCKDEALTGLESSDYGLLAPFGDGMLEGLSPQATLIDGHEKAYAYTRNSRFAAAGAEVEDAGDVSSVPHLYRERMQVGFGLMLDNRYNVRGGFHTDTESFVDNHFTPQEWGNALYFAMLNADEYVWVWNELRGAVFFEASPRSVAGDPGWAANVPDAYVAAMKQARNARDMHAGRDNRAAARLPVPAPAREMQGYSDAETFGPLLAEYEIVADLPKEWLFHRDDEALGIGYYTAADWDDSDWESIRIGDYFQRQGHRFRGIAWYRCRFEVPAELAGQTVFLMFGAVSTNHFFVNGHWIGQRERKNGVWIADFSEWARFGETNLITLSIVTTGEPAGVYKSVKLAVRKNTDVE